MTDISACWWRNCLSQNGKQLCRLGVLVCIAVFWVASPVFGRAIIDMSGRKVTIPDTISKVVGISPPATYLLYAIDPGLIGGLNFPLWEDEKKYTVEGYGKLPVIGGMFGQGRTLNLEALLKVNPDFVLYWAWKNEASYSTVEKAMAQLNVPRVAVRLDSIIDYPEALQFLGDTLNKGDRAKRLQSYATTALAEVKTVVAGIPNDQNLSVYYAEGLDGLYTEKSGSSHAELIPLAGGINVHKGEEADTYGMEKISMEQLLLYDPEVILVKERSFFTDIFIDPRWKNIRAVKSGRVYLIPVEPFNWFDRPPSFMRLLGVKWLLNVLHPHRYQIDMVAETRAFYQLFLRVKLSEQDAREILN
jgi:iron complex transport system substrate-binding protein